MAFGNNVTLTYSIQDIKGKKSRFGINFPETSDIPLTGSYSPYGVDQAPNDGFASSTAALIIPMILGRIVGASLRIRVNLTGAGLKTSPVANTDVEEGAKFSWRSTVGAPTVFRVPTFLEQYGLSTGTAVDTNDADVNAFVQRILQGDTQGATTVRWSDSRGNNVSTLNYAEDSFKKSRKRR